MRLFGWEIGRAKPAREQKALAAVAENRGWWPLVREPYPGAWQKNVTVDQSAVTAYHAVYACATLIASDIAKLRIKLVQREASGIWAETESPAFSPVLRKPNHFQTRIQFVESWVLSKLMRGNAYILKERDNRGVVVRGYVLDPTRTRPMVGDDGSVWYELATDKLAGIQDRVSVPASEIIHDRWNCLFHPLVGVSPIYASGLAATQGLAIQNNSARFFGNSARPSGFLVTPGTIDKDLAEMMKEQWRENFSGDNYGKIAVLAGGVKFEPMTMTAEDAQLIDQLRWTAEVVASVYHVPRYKIGIGDMPSYNNIQSLNVEYYSQCLQKLIEDAEACLDEGLGLSAAKDGVLYGVEFDLDGLLRMDSVTQIEAIEKGVKAGVLAPNEGRRKLDLPPATGGDSPYLQQQNYSLEALAKRDAQENPFAQARPPEPVKPQPANDVPQETPDDAEQRSARRRAMADRLRSRADHFA